MLRPLRVTYMGYAAATTGGVQFEASMEVPEGRFPSIRDDETIVLNIGAPLRTSSVSYRVVPKTVDGDGSIFYGEQQKLSREEQDAIAKWVKDVGIRKQANDLADKFKKATDYYLSVCDELQKVYEDKRRPAANLDELLKQNKEIAEMQSKAEAASAEIEKLRNIDL